MRPRGYRRRGGTGSGDVAFHDVFIPRQRCVHPLGATPTIDLAYETGGGSSVFAANPLQRCFRDVHTATQHLMVSPRVLETVGRIRLGQDVDLSLF